MVPRMPESVANCSAGFAKPSSYRVNPVRLREDRISDRSLDGPHLYQEVNGSIVSDAALGQAERTLSELGDQSGGFGGNPLITEDDHPGHYATGLAPGAAGSRPKFGSEVVRSWGSRRRGFAKVDLVP